MAFIPNIIERTGARRTRLGFVQPPAEGSYCLPRRGDHRFHRRTVVAQLLYLQLENKEADIELYIMSPGGSVTAGLAIYDTMQHVTNDVATYCFGQAASMGAFLLASGAKGKRFALPHARIMIHQPWGGAQGTASDIVIQAEEIIRLKGSLNELYAKHTGQPIDRIVKDSDRDYFMSAEQAKEYGLVTRF